MKQVGGIVLLGLLTLTVGVRGAEAKNCPQLCSDPIRACRAAVAPASTCHAPHRHACVAQLRRQRVQCKTDLLAQCRQNPDPATCTTVCDFTQHPCTGTLTGAVTASFNCSNAFANNLRLPGGTNFIPHVETPPSGVSSLGFVLDFVGSPAAKEYDFPANPQNGEFLPTSYVALNVPGGGSSARRTRPAQAASWGALAR